MKDVEVSQSATPATQSEITACFEAFNEERFCSFPHRHCDGTIETSDSRRDTLEHQNEHFARDFLTFHTSQLQNQRFPTNSLTGTLLEIDVLCDASVDFHHMSQNATPATEFAPCHHFAQPWQCDSQKNTQHDTSEVLRLPRKMTSEVSKLLCLPRKLHLLKTLRKYCACHTKPLLTRHERC